MAPRDFPEEVDVFSIPHSRMKALVDKYFDKLQCTDFSDGSHMTELLKVLNNVFFEFKQHEHIEDRFIMRKLRSKLKERSVRNKAVCNCHKDNRLNEMLDLVKYGYSCTWKSEADRINYGIKLRTALEEFTKTFIPHMQEEEEVFQPLLMKYFTYEELIHIKTTVIVEHEIKQRDYAGQAQLEEDKENDTSGCESESEDETEVRTETTATVTPAPTTVHHLPPELITRIFSHLQPRDLCACAQVCADWSEVAMTPGLWTNISPVKWAKGDWTFSIENEEATCDDECSDDEDEEYYDGGGSWLDEDADVDEDADKDESTDSGEEDSGPARMIQRESRILMGISKHLLPRVGVMVRSLDLAHSKALTNAVMTKMLYYCPNLETLDLSQTRVSDTVFKSLNTESGCHLKKLVLSGCVNITDSSLIRLAQALDRAQTQACCARTTQKDADSEQHTPQTGINSDCLCEQYTAYQNNMQKCQNTVKISSVTKDICIEPNLCCGKKNRRDESEMPAERACVEGSDLSNNNDVDVSSCEDKVTECECSHLDSTERDSDSERCHQECHVSHCYQNIEECADKVVRREMGNHGHKSDRHVTRRTKFCTQKVENNRSLQHLNLSGCFQITDLGLKALSENGGLPNLLSVDLSGCWHLSGNVLAAFVSSCPRLSGEQLYYCDNILGGPDMAMAGGCQNLECDKRYCCRLGH